jgi:arylsulfatase A-like enzyme
MHCRDADDQFMHKGGEGGIDDKGGQLCRSSTLGCVVRWPGKIKPGTVSNEMVAHHDWLPTFLAMAGDADVTDKLLKGYTIGDMTYKVLLDGYNLVLYLTGEVEKSPRVSFIYCNDDQQLVALRYDNWKLVFAEQRQPGTLRVWSEPFVTLRDRYG